MTCELHICFSINMFEFSLEIIVLWWYLRAFVWDNKFMLKIKRKTFTKQTFNDILQNKLVSFLCWTFSHQWIFLYSFCQIILLYSANQFFSRSHENKTLSQHGSEDTTKMIFTCYTISWRERWVNVVSSLVDLQAMCYFAGELSCSIYFYL